jgi:general L-amino acid transport system permease protein
MTTQQPPKNNNWSWRSQAFRGVIYQILAVAVITFLVWFLASNTLHNMKTRGIQSGFDFLFGTTGFDVSESLFAFDSSEPLWVAFMVGISNMLRVAVVGIILTTILGTLLGVGRFSRNILVRGICLTYVEVFRNIPVLLQLLVWYLFFTEVLPAADEAWTIGNVFLSKGGFTFPIPIWATGHLVAVFGLIVGLVLAYFYRRKVYKKFEETGQISSLFWVPLAIFLASGFIGWIVGGYPTAMNTPFKGEFAIENGGSLTPEYLSVLIGLTMYTSAFVAEVVRSGISSVSKGQQEAASALGLSPSQTMRLVTLPQALRVIIPPMTNQFLNLTKNSSLAVAIGYQEVVSIANTSMNQTGRAVECIAIIMLVYLTTSLMTSFFMNWYNTKSAIKER